MDLGKYEGPVILKAVDYQGRYESAEKVVQVSAGDNAVTLTLIPTGGGLSPSFDWGWVLLFAGVSMVGVFGFYGWKRRKG